MYKTKPRKTATHGHLFAVSVKDIKYGGWKRLWISIEYVLKDAYGYFSSGLPASILGPVNTNPIGPVVPEKAPIKAHPKGTSFGAQPVGLGLFFRPAALSFAYVA
ncbi:MAG: hypothetical protein AB2653_05315 [Candidatus Thiodiazotropha endolucinida]